MKQLFTLIALITITTSTFAQTTVSGEQSGTWTAANSPYQVTGDIMVASGETLTIEAGVTVDFQGHFKLTILGTLTANGIENDLVYFTTTTSFTTGWNGISIGKSTTGSEIPADGISHFTYCKFQYGMTASSNESLNINGGAVRLISSNAEFNDCTFAGNSTYIGEGMGGAVYCRNTGSNSGVLTKFTNCKFLSNVGYSEGGAVKLTGDQNTEFINCEFRNNRTSYGGGAIMFYSVVGTKMINSLFVGNKTINDNGGALKTLGVGNEIYLKNCTIEGNSADAGSGGAIAVYYGTADFVNCIAYNNSSQYDDDNVYIDAGTGTGTVNYCNMIMPEYNTTGNNNIEANPLFVDATNGNFHLQETSPCIDAGTDIGLPFSGTAPDMGCYEYEQNTFINTEKTEDIFIYPNPTNGEVKILGFKNTTNINIEVTNITGKLIKTSSSKNINISELNSGIYFLNIKIGNKTYIKKLIKK